MKLLSGVRLLCCLVLGGCASSVTGVDSGTDVVHGTDAARADTAQADTGSSATCPSDLANAAGTPCSNEGQSCGTCSDPCQFCNLLTCSSGRWETVEVFPGECDAGSDANVASDANVTNEANVTATCPSDTSAALGTPCTDENQICGDCPGGCNVCHQIICTGGTWQAHDLYPPCDGGLDFDAAGTTPCGTTTCSAGEVCVHTVAGGGPCIQPVDGGCGPNQQFNGTCCSFWSESWTCAPMPSGCDGTLSCGCAMSLCTGGSPSCPCTGASGNQLDCACEYP